MTNDEAIKWLRRRSVLAIFHQDRIVLVAPRGSFVVDTRERRLEIRVGNDFTVAMSDPGDSLADVVQAAQAAWRSSASPVDALADAYGQKAPPAELKFIGDINALFGEIAG